MMTIFFVLSDFPADQIEVLNDLIDEVERIKLQQQMSPLRQKPTNESHAAAGPSTATGSKYTGQYRRVL